MTTIKPLIISRFITNVEKNNKFRAIIHWGGHVARMLYLKQYVLSRTTVRVRSKDFSVLLKRIRTYRDI